MLVTANQNTTNTRSLVAVVEKFLDYAGMFPPAKLPLLEAFANYVKYAGDQYSWLLSRFICPANNLLQLADIIKLQFEDTNYPLRIAVLGKGGESIKDYRNEFLNDINNLKAFRSRFKSNIYANVYEVRIPDQLIISKDEAQITEIVNFTISELEEKVGKDLKIYFEGVNKADWDNSIDLVTYILSNFKDEGKNIGYKIRLAGLTAIDIPTCRQLAVVLLNCLDRSLPIKATQGLHHPFRHYNEDVHGKMHGFINLFTAAIIGNRHGVEGDVLIKILEDENADNFVFNDDMLVWNGYEVDMDWIKYGRDDVMHSFGSCSFDEPVSDMLKYNLI
ncbi:MAG TPA: hypothetical protein PLG90_11530 [Ignavibacteria bacterium]|nr:hypothetical protein [Ignavibacteria bacterium]